MMTFTAQPIPTAETRSWILRRHYAHRMPIIEMAFGLFNGTTCVGVCTFGDGSGNINNNSLGMFKMNELNRLVLEEGLPSNTASFFVSRCLKLLPRPRVVVSYADAEVGHVGYVYQATNWIYTGTSEGRRVYMKDGIEHHRKSVYDMLGKHSVSDAAEHGFIYHTGKSKHRYLYFVGNKSERGHMLKLLPYDVLPYPKGKTNRHDASATIETQGILF